MNGLAEGLESTVLLYAANNRKYLQAVLRQNVAFFDKLGAGEITNRLTHDINLIQDGISDKVMHSWQC